MGFLKLTTVESVLLEIQTPLLQKRGQNARAKEEKRVSWVCKGRPEMALLRCGPTPETLLLGVALINE